MKTLLPTLLMLLLSTTADAADISADRAWVRLLPGDLPAAGYVHLHNNGDHQASLIGADSSAFADIEIHQSSDHGGMMRMQRVDAVAIPAAGDATLQPGGYHLMLFERADGIQVGGQASVTLQFADGSRLPVSFALRNASGQ